MATADEQQEKGGPGAARRFYALYLLLSAGCIAAAVTGIALLYQRDSCDLGVFFVKSPWYWACSLRHVTNDGSPEVV
jgi:hypothetical protein